MQVVNFKSSLNIFLGMLLLLTIVGFVTNEYFASRKVERIQINLDESGNFFVDEGGIRKALMEVVEANMNTDSVGNITIRKEVDLATIEQELLRYSFVKEAQASWDIKGSLVIDILQDEPIARIINSSGKGAYISRERNLLPLSRDFTARVMLVTGQMADSLLSEIFLKGEKGQQITALIDHINQDEFLSSQITQMEVNKWMSVTLHPQVGRQRIEFGKPENFAEKFDKLDIFYKQIVPKQGWKKYKTVKLQFKDQIVCK